MIKLWDFGCACGKEYRDWPCEGRIPETIKCECGKRASWVKMRKNQINLTASTMYGKVDPRFGVKVEDYGHKKQLLREHGLVEGDVERHDDIQDDVEARKQRQDRHKRDPNTLVADSLDEITDRISTDMIDRRATGNLRGRPDQDPKTGLIQSWVGF